MHSKINYLILIFVSIVTFVSIFAIIDLQLFQSGAQCQVSNINLYKNLQSVKLTWEVDADCESYSQYRRVGEENWNIVNNSSQSSAKNKQSEIQNLSRSANYEISIYSNGELYWDEKIENPVKIEIENF